MAKTKADWLKEANDLGIEVDAKAKVADIQKLIEKGSADTESAAKPVSDTAEEVKAVQGPENGPEEASTVAKAGKRSAKALKEESEKQAKEERKAGDETVSDKPKPSVKPSRSRLERSNSVACCSSRALASTMKRRLDSTSARSDAICCRMTSTSRASRSSSGGPVVVMTRS